MPNFAIFEPYQLMYDPDLISRFGPNQAGWKGIILRPYYASALPTFTAAQNAGYNPILAALDRNAIVARDWAAIDQQIAFGKQHGTHWVYVDDALSGGGISKDQIDTVAAKVRAAPSCPLATAEYDQNKLQQNPSWHQNADVMMPYGYHMTPAELNAFLWWVRYYYPSKDLVPFLGYQVYDPNTSQFYTQLDPHISVAEQYSTQNLIFYYTEYFGNLDSLTVYLQTHYGMGH